MRDEAARADRDRGGGIELGAVPSTRSRDRRQPLHLCARAHPATHWPTALLPHPRLDVVDAAMDKKVPN
ncbi:hypothetical protein [Roseococcus sp. SYP-B2431]|uniref:hypothetical protein n=1 Tax=Roseococcus sp. SYP-B2431 TaxID=2496640 RepID=UPI00103CCA53|nr:hypothetical protein [Roseococcus sp. SYP-B2431]